MATTLQMPVLSVLIPWCNRREIRTTLAHNVPILHRFGAEILIMNCGGDAEQLKILLFDSGFAGLPDIWITDLLHPHFNRSYALNIGVHLSKSSRVFVLDADILLNTEIVRDALEILERSAFVTVENVFESQPRDNLFGGDSSKQEPLSVVKRNFVDISLADGTSIRICTFRRNEVDGSRAGPGLIFLRKKDLIQVEGYNGDLQYWGWEDNDLQVRLKRVLNLEHFEVGNVLHLSHGDGDRALFGKSPESTNRSNLGVCCERYAQGNFRGTYSRDVESWISKRSQ